jgi:hypothetical protein
MYINAKTKPVESTPGTGGGRDKGERWKGNFKYAYLIHYNNFCNATMYPHPTTTIKEKSKNKIKYWGGFQDGG